MWHSLILQDYFECALVTHRFALNDIMKAYDVFGNAAKELAWLELARGHELQQYRCRAGVGVFKVPIEIIVEQGVHAVLFCTVGRRTYW